MASRGVPFNKSGFGSRLLEEGNLGSLVVTEEGNLGSLVVTEEGNLGSLVVTEEGNIDI